MTLGWEDSQQPFDKWWDKFHAIAVGFNSDVGTEYCGRLTAQKKRESVPSEQQFAVM